MKPGAAFVFKKVTCPLCDGKGQRYVRRYPISAPSNIQLEKCCDCDGTGEVVRKVKVGP